MWKQKERMIETINNPKNKLAVPISGFCNISIHFPEVVSLYISERRYKTVKANVLATQ